MRDWRPFQNGCSACFAIAILLLAILGCGGSNEPIAGDRSNLSVADALAGHWKSKDGLMYEKNEYYKKFPAEAEAGSSKPKFDFYYKMSWDTGLGEKSDGETRMFVHELDEKAGTMVLKHTSSDGVYTYYNRYTFNEARNEFSEEEIDEKTGESVYDLVSVLVYAGSKDKADHTK